MPYLFCTALILPAIAIYQTINPTNWSWVLLYFASVSLITYGLYWHDKAQSRKNAWRIPESQLHLAEFLGGWPVAFIAQRQFRHKTRKRRFQVTYWIIVILHQYIAIELAFNWPLGGSLQVTN
ncbi:MAG: DUF1294 domain-containing protein [Coraliomargarita sp.]